MFTRILFKYIIGYLCIKIDGFNVERLMTKAINRKILMWNIKREKSTIIYANIGVKDFKELTKLSKKDKCKVKIIRKKGIPFILHKYKKRRVLLIFASIAILILFGLSNFVWNIQIEGINKISPEEILSTLEEEGLRIGTLKAKIDSSKIINNIRLERNDISWIGIELKGTNAIIKIAEREEKPEIVDEDDYCNIVASKDTQIIKISAQNGIPVVKEGDIVTKGTILIAGWIDGKYTGTRYVHSNGEVKGKVWYSEKERIPFIQKKYEETGNSENKYQIKINNFTINLYKTLSKFEIYDTIEKNKKVKIFSNFYLPIELVKKTNYEKRENEITYGNEEAKQIGIEKLSKTIEEKIAKDDEVLQKYINTYEGNDYVDVEVIYEVLESIGTKEKIVF